MFYKSRKLPVYYDFSLDYEPERLFILMATYYEEVSISCKKENMIFEQFLFEEGATEINELANKLVFRKLSHK